MAGVDLFGFGKSKKSQTCSFMKPRLVPHFSVIQSPRFVGLSPVESKANSLISARVPPSENHAEAVATIIIVCNSAAKLGHPLLERRVRGRVFLADYRLCQTLELPVPRWRFWGCCAKHAFENTYGRPTFPQFRPGGHNHHRTPASPGEDVAGFNPFGWI